MKALTERQPWASLVTAGVKTIETRARPTSYRGRIAIHAAQHGPVDGMRVGEWEVYYPNAPGFVRGPLSAFPMPLGAVVGSAVLTDCVPIVHRDTMEGATARGPRLIVVGGPNDRFGHTVGHFRDDGQVSADLTDQLPFGDFTPGRWALLLDDAKPTTERCPWCWGTGRIAGAVPGVPASVCTVSSPCPVCWPRKANGEREFWNDGRAGRCDPVPARGHSGLWEWTP